jgi:hypothetical protein
MRCAARPQERGRGLSEFKDKTDGVVEERIIFIRVGIGAVYAGALVSGRLEEGLDIFSLALGLPECDHRGGLFLADVGRMQAHEAAGAGGQEEHVASA